MLDLFRRMDEPDIKRLLDAGWIKVSLWGQDAWKSPDGKFSTLYTSAAISRLKADAKSSQPHPK